MRSGAELARPSLAASSVVSWAAVLGLALVLGVAVARRPTLVALALLASILVLLVLFRQVQILVPLTSAALVIGSSSFALSPRVTLTAKFAVMGAVGATAFTWIRGVPERRVPHSFAVAFLGLVGLAVVSTGYSIAPAATFEHGLSLLVLWLAVAVAIPLAWRDQEDFLRLLIGVAAVAVATVAAGVILTAGGFLAGFEDARFQGIFANPNTLAFFVAPILPSLVLAISEKAVRRRGVLMITVVVIAAALVMSGSRAGLLSCAVGTAVGFAAARRSGRVLAVVLVITALVGALLVVSGLSVRPGTESREGLLERGTGSGRLVAWPDGLRLIAEHPITGIGFATTPIVFPVARDQRLFKGFEGQFGRLHNSYLEAALDLGWPGAVFVFLLALSGAVAAWRASRRRDAWGGFGAILVAGIVGGMVEAFFESGLLAAGGLLAFHFWLLVAAAHAIQVRIRSEARRADSESTAPHPEPRTAHSLA